MKLIHLSLIYFSCKDAVLKAQNECFYTFQFFDKFWLNLDKIISTNFQGVCFQCIESVVQFNVKDINSFYIWNFLD